MPQMAGTEIYPESKIIEILHLSEAQIQALHNMPRMTHFYCGSHEIMYALAEVKAELKIP